jgi:hypothetical protein
MNDLAHPAPLLTAAPQTTSRTGAQVLLERWWRSVWIPSGRGHHEMMWSEATVYSAPPPAWSPEV